VPCRAVRAEQHDAVPCRAVQRRVGGLASERQRKAAARPCGPQKMERSGIWSGNWSCSARRRRTVGTGLWCNPTRVLSRR
jgi:hypothetical protein